MFISSAWAQDAAVVGSSPFVAQLFSFLPIVLIFIIFYFLILRPQNEAVKQHTKLLDSLKKGDRVVTQGGIIGAVTKIEGDTAFINVNKDVEIEVVKASIQRVLIGEKEKSIKHSNGSQLSKKR